MSRLSRGFGIIDVIVAIALLLILFLALFGVLRASLVLSALAKAKAAAVEVASTQIEYLRGLSYDSIGTVGGIPAGAVAQTATSTVDGVIYVTHTYIEYYDDPADGTTTHDTNSITTDYKVGKVKVSYTLNGISKSVVLVSNFIPPSIESSTGGGTLSLHVVNASGGNVGGATIHIVNASTSPAIDFTTFTDTNGFAVIGGAATSSEYQIYVSSSGYSSAQTYARSGQNVNPTPGYLTVAKDQTTSATFAIDQLASLALSTFSPAVTTAFSDTFSNTSNVANQNSTQVAGGALTLTSQSLLGSATSIPINPTNLDGWGILSANISTPPGTSIVVQVGNASGVAFPDAVLTGNTAGFSTFPVTLTGINVSTYPALTLLATLASNATSTTPSLLDWSVSHTEGPSALVNTSFTLTGAKTIGSDVNGAPIYKTVVNDTTGGTGQKTESLEWDGYTLALGQTLIEGCVPAPYQLSPATATTTALIIGTPAANTLPVLVQDGTGSAIGNAKVILSASGYAATIPTSSCGLAYFNTLANGTYSATVSAQGHATTTTPSIVVSGHTATTTVTLP